MKRWEGRRSTDDLRMEPNCWLVMGSEMLNSCGNCGRDIRVFLSTGAEPAETDARGIPIKNVMVREDIPIRHWPVDVLSTIQFVESLDTKICSLAWAGPHNIVYCVDAAQATQNNAVRHAAFLLGAFMILKLGVSHTDVECVFEGLHSVLYQLRSHQNCDHRMDLTLIDCWRGLQRGKERGWIAASSLQNPTMWGLIDIDIYKHYNNPANASLHEVVPKKFVAFKGPKNLNGPLYRDDGHGEFLYRDFSPQYYLDIFRELNVSTVIRLNEPHYDASIFTSNGFEHHDLAFDDGASPPPDVVSRFCRIADAARGVVAVHGQGGGGRGGTLIALYMMRCYGFSAREAIAWVRTMRPGSVVGEQPQYLCIVEDKLRRVVEARSQSPATPTTALLASVMGVPGADGGKYRAAEGSPSAVDAAATSWADSDAIPPPPPRPTRMPPEPRSRRIP